MYKSYLKKILTANVYNVAKETPLEYGYNLSNITKNSIYYKREDLQSIFSFKLRGAYNKIYNLSLEEKQNGIVACSAGNHAQGVALSSQQMNIDTIIVMPTITPTIKIEQVKKYNATLLLYGDNYDEAQEKALEICKNENRTLIHPYNDPEVIAGQGTIGLELLKQINNTNIDVIFCPVGGGGLISGIGSYIKNVMPNIKIIGVEDENTDCMTQSLYQNKRITLDTIGSFADGTAVKQVGDITFQLCKEIVDDMVIVSNDEISSSINKFYKDTRTIIEPSGALSIAGCEKYINKNNIIGKNFINIISGANMDFKRLRFIAERADENEQFVSITIPEKPGSFKKLYSYVYPNNVTEFSYRYNATTEASIYMSFYCNGSYEKIISNLIKNQYTVINLSNNDLAKDHLRYLVGGKLKSDMCEVIFRFHFPEKPGELGKFLDKISNRWNITLFHYRNHGSDIGKVLVGFDISKKNIQEIYHYINELGYKYYNETDNPIYTQFLIE